MPSYLIWKLLSGLNDSNVVIRKLEVRGLDLDLRHVTRGALFVSDRTALAVAGFCSLVSQRVTLQTSFIVVTCVLAERLMRIVTSRTAYVPIIRITLAVKDTIRLKTHVVDFHALQQRELLSATMTRCAKLLRQFIATQQSRIVDRLRRSFACFDRRDVLSAGTMTSLTPNSVCKLIETQLRTADNRTRRVTTETIRHLVRRQQAADSVSQ